METAQVIETSETFLQWFTDYGALQILALCGLVWPVVIIVLIVYAIRKLGRPAARIADSLEKSEGSETK